MFATLLFFIVLLLLIVGFAFQRQPDDLRLNVPRFSVQLLKSKWIFIFLSVTFLTLHFLVPDSIKPFFMLSRTGLKSGLWFQFITHCLFHADITHLTGNLTAMVCLSAYWRQLKPMEVLLIFLLGAIVAGGLGITIQNDAHIGASGGIAAIFGALIFQGTEAEGPKVLFASIGFIFIIYILVNLMPSENTQYQTGHIAHLAGFIFGLGYSYFHKVFAKMNFALLPMRAFAGILCIIAIAAFTYSAILPAKQIYSRWQLKDMRKLLFQKEQSLPNIEEGKKDSADLIQHFPRDPRAHLIHAFALLDLNDKVDAELELRTGLNEKQILKEFFPPILEIRLRIMLALLLIDKGQTEEAKMVAIPICPQIAMEGPLQKEAQNITRHFRHLINLSRDQIKQVHLCEPVTNAR
jgi:rhomboid protease GluP